MFETITVEITKQHTEAYDIWGCIPVYEAIMDFLKSEHGWHKTGSKPISIFCPETKQLVKLYPSRGLTKQKDWFTNPRLGKYRFRCEVIEGAQGL